MFPSVRVGDLHVCPKKGHGTNPIVTGSSTALFNGKPVARVGDKTACGATIITGSSTVFVDGMPAAIVGSKTSHGGVIVSGSENIFLGDEFGGGSNFTSTETTPSQSPNAYDQHFQLIDKKTGKPAQNFVYLMDTPEGEVCDAVCEQGKTELYQSDTQKNISLINVRQIEIGMCI